MKSRTRIERMRRRGEGERGNKIRRKLEIGGTEEIGVQ
jgi:hypothetical protein